MPVNLLFHVDPFQNRREDDGSCEKHLVVGSIHEIEGYDFHAVAKEMHEGASVHLQPPVPESFPRNELFVALFDEMLLSGLFKDEESQN